MADIAKLRQNLERRGFQTSYFQTVEEANAYLDRALEGVTIGFGGSVTVQDMGIYDRLSSRSTCSWHWYPEKDRESACQDAAQADVYICSLNGVSENGELVNIDGSGNRVASCLYGHKKVYFIIGVNKIAPDYVSALWRARTIAAPLNARRLNKKTPCAQGELRCHDCSSPDRICAALVVYWEKPAMAGEVEVIIVNQELGF